MTTAKTRKRSGDDDDNGLISTIFCNDVLFEILSRCPVKSLMKFKCVSKRLRSLIEDDTHFLDLHLARSITRRDLVITIPSSGALLGPLNGLVCLVDLVNGSACIQNFSTREITPWIETPISKKKKVESDNIRQFGEFSSSSFDPTTDEYKITYMNQVWGFGFHPATREHKVICMWEPFSNVEEMEPIIEILTVGENTWRRLDEVPPCGLAGPAIYANGFIYRKNINYDAIIAFDVGSEKFSRVIPIPNFIIDQVTRDSFHHMPNLELLEVDDRIAILSFIDEYTIKLWISCDEEDANHQDNSNKESMNKLMTTTTINWIEETIILPCVIGNGLRINHLYAISGTDQMLVPVPHSNSKTDRKSTSERLIVPYYY